MSIPSEEVGEMCGVIDGKTYIYISELKVSKGFRSICKCIPRKMSDHHIWARAEDGSYAGITRPYPFRSYDMAELDYYCSVVGLEATVLGATTWNPRCTKILLVKDKTNAERYDIAIQNSKWRNFDSYTHSTENMLNMTIEKCKAKGVN